MVRRVVIDSNSNRVRDGLRRRATHSSDGVNGDRQDPYNGLFSEVNKEILGKNESAQNGRDAMDKDEPGSRRLNYHVAVSLDGYIADP